MRVDLRLPKKTLEALQTLAQLAGTSVPVVVKVFAASAIMRELNTQAMPAARPS